MSDVDYVTAWVHRCRRDVVVAQGSEVVSYLHGQITQDVESMEVGGSRLSMILEPKGLLEALFRITKVGEDEFWLDVPVGVGESLVESLERFKLRTDVNFTLCTGSMSALRIMFADASDPAQPSQAPMTINANAEGALVAAQCFWYGETPSAAAPAANAVDLLELTEKAQATVSVVIAEGAERGAAVEVRDLDAASYAYLRCFVGLPEMGTELAAGAVPNETGLLDLAVNFTKGCYRGQELVERIDSRAGGRRSVMRFYADAEIAVGDAVFGAELALLAADPSAARQPGIAKPAATVLSAATFHSIDPDLRDQVANHGKDVASDPASVASDPAAASPAGDPRAAAPFTDDIRAPLTVGFVRTEPAARTARDSSANTAADASSGTDGLSSPAGGFVLAPVAFAPLTDPEA